MTIWESLDNAAKATTVGYVIYYAIRYGRWEFNWWCDLFRKLFGKGKKDVSRISVDDLYPKEPDGTDR